MMILLHTKNIILAGFTLGFLAACSSTTTTGGNDNNNNGGEGCPDGQELNEFDVCVDITNGGDTRGDVTTGTESTTDSSNGLAFADGTAANLNHIDTVPMTLRILKLVKTVDGDATILSAELEDATITIGEKVQGVREVSITFAGETESVTFDTQSDTGTFTYNLVDYDFVIDHGANYVVVFEATSANPDFAPGDVDGILYRAYTGFETNPSQFSGFELEDPDALAIYAGAFDVFFASDGESGNFEVDGTIAISADFAAGTISGDLTESDLTADFSGDISGNGWNATIGEISITNGDDSLASGGGQLDGVFYGPEGEETAGTIIIDATLTNGIDDDIADYDVVGGGGFVADCVIAEECITPVVPE